MDAQIAHITQRCYAQSELLRKMRADLQNDTTLTEKSISDLCVLDDECNELTHSPNVSREEFVQFMATFNERLDDICEKRTIAMLICIKLAMMVDRIKNTWNSIYRRQITKTDVIVLGSAIAIGCVLYAHQQNRRIIP